MNIKKSLASTALVAASLLGGAAGVSLLGTANAATPAPVASTAAGTAASTPVADPHPGDNGADGVAESAEVHTGNGGPLGMSGTVTAVTGSSVTIKTATATTTYTVASGSDIDKKGEAALSSLAVGDSVTFSVDPANATQIDKLHA